MKSQPEPLTANAEKLRLSSEESHFVEDFQRTVKNLPAKVSVSDFMEGFFATNEYSYALKHHVAKTFLHLTPAKQWGYEFMESLHLWSLASSHPLNTDCVPFAIRNSNWTRVTSQPIFYKRVSKSTKRKFYEGISPELKTFDFLSGLILDLEETNLDPDMVFADAKNLLGLDENFPNSWVIRIFDNKVEPFTTNS